MKVAIVHDWLVSSGGAERCLKAFLEIYPQATVFTSVCDFGNLPDFLRGRDIKTSFLQKIPMAKKNYRSLLPLMPFAFESFDLRGYDLVISNSNACAKGVITEPSTCHICYCLSPMRYVWDMAHEYLEIEKVGWLGKKISPYLMSYLRMWDAVSAARVDDFVAISKYISGRIKKYYRRDSTVIYPPVETGLYLPSDGQDDYYLAFSRLVPQKRMDIIVEAFNRLGYPLKVIGIGRDLKKLKSIAKKNVEFLGYLSDKEVSVYMARCKALVFASQEDFGIVPLEAQSAGRPVIIYRKGGALETVIEGKTGVYFDEQTADSVCAGVKKFEEINFDPEEIRTFAKTFDTEIFKKKFAEYAQMKVEEHKRGL